PIVRIVDAPTPGGGLKPMRPNQSKNHAADPDGAGNTVREGFAVVDRRRVHEYAGFSIAPRELFSDVARLPRVLTASVADEEGGRLLRRGKVTPNPSQTGALPPLHIGIHADHACGGEDQPNDRVSDGHDPPHVEGQLRDGNEHT